MGMDSEAERLSAWAGQVRLKNEWPPNVDEIREVFPLTGDEIFAWDGIIYNPGGGELSDSLIAHECVHFAQQNGDPEEWWARYIGDGPFRFEQELEAHQVEYRTYCISNKDRNDRSNMRITIARRLASGMYGHMIDMRRAMYLIN